jgi:hypothetical protein
MVLIPVRCPQCHSDQVIKGGVTKAIDSQIMFRGSGS